jgi:nicotinate-nucleotide adenylyltransferase
MARRLRIGLLGGSFNPAHQGHMHVSKAALRALGLDYIWWLVSPQNPLKSKHAMGPLERRVTIASKLAQHPRVIVTVIENELGTIYTADTLKALLRRFPAAHFVWLMGSDNLVQIPHWRDWRTIFAMMPVAVVSRPGTALKALTGKAAQIFTKARAPADIFLATRYPPAWTVIDARHDRTSATQIRAQHRQ